MATGRVLDFPGVVRRTRARTRGETRDFLEYLMTRGTEADLASADPAWFAGPPFDVCGSDWYEQFGDATFLRAARSVLLGMVIELRYSSRAPAARALNPAAWFEEWVELPQPALDGRAPSQVLCTRDGLEAVKVLLRALQDPCR